MYILEDKVHQDIFDDHVQSLVTELVTYIRKHFEEKILDYNSSRKDLTVKPESPIDTIDEYVEGVKMLIDGMIDSELRDMYNELLYKVYQYEGEEGNKKI